MSLRVTGPASGVLELRLDRPARRNAITLEMARALLDAVHRAHDAPAVRCILLTGEGPAFCAGKDRDEPPSAEFVDTLQLLAKALMDGGKPVVAAAQGWAVGAGLELLLNCDVVVAGAGTRFMLPEVHAGLFGTGGVLSLLPRKIGLAKAKGVLMLGREFGAAEAEQWGLIWQVVADAQLAPHARDLAERLAAGDAAILAEIKWLLHRESLGDLQDALMREAQAHRRLARR